MIIVNEARLHDLLDEANGFLVTMTGNLSDETLSLDHGQIRYGLNLVLMEAMNRVREVMGMLKAPESAEISTTD